ncbi:hypothetical protein [Polaromonas sp. CG9_12]|nr:hypothetical protein [Polaromonas sp. CG9_12]
MEICNESKEPPDSLIKSALPSASYHVTPHGAAQPVLPGFLTGQA